ncbi:TNFSF10 [Branchiostoma lanceolatum]|uniref:Tumor necrosis factor ligand superfamily member 10 n=1 Tax=Branchiostoma lanceolatum TaxID=7740 RepID=A0A8J9Z1Z3_BRALA|nr:TNFSF10 [Branchiostoma lanceolatum]
MLSTPEPSYSHFGWGPTDPPPEGAEKTAKIGQKSSKCPVIIAVSICSVVNAAVLSAVACVWVELQREVEDIRRSHLKLQDRQYQHGGLNETALELAVEKHLTDLREKEEGTVWLPTDRETPFGNVSRRTHKPTAHLTGSPQADSLSDGKNGLSKIKSWETRQGLATLANGMRHRRGHLIIPTDGLYFIYSQLYYRFLNPEQTQSKTYQLIHYTFKQNSYPKPLQIMKSARNTCWSKNVEFGLYTSYQGGVFRLQKGDKIWVAVSNMSMVCLEETSSYFGAFMI